MLRIKKVFFLCLIFTFFIKRVDAVWIDGTDVLVEKIEETILKFAQTKSDGIIFFEESGKFFYGIHQKKQLSQDYTDLKTHVSNRMGTTNKIVQIIGSCEPFSVTGTIRAREFLLPFLQGDSIIEYGYTSSKSEDNQQLDINALVTEFIEQNPDEARRAFANIVGSSVKSIRKWNSIASNLISNFLVIYNDSLDLEGQTCFGDDVVASDYIVSEEDTLIIVEGSVQTFRQAVNALSQNLSIFGLYNVKQEEHKNYFSTAEFLSIVKLNLERNKNLSQSDVNMILNQYLETHTLPWSVEPDPLKQSLFESAVNDLIEKELYKKLAGASFVQ